MREDHDRHRLSNVQAKDDARIRCPMSVGHCVKAKSNGRRESLTTVEWCAQATTNAVSPRSTSAERFSQATDDVIVHDLYCMDDVTCRRHFGYPKHIILGLCWLPLDDVTVTLPIRTRDEWCVQALVDVVYHCPISLFQIAQSLDIFVWHWTMKILPNRCTYATTNAYMPWLIMYSIGQCCFWDKRMSCQMCAISGWCYVQAKGDEICPRWTTLSYVHKPRPTWPFHAQHRLSDMHMPWPMQHSMTNFPWPMSLR